MALNVIGSNDNAINTFHQKMNKLPLISLINKKDFKLTTKKRGKILNKPVYSGFNKNTLSSIPRDVEIILLDKNKEEIFGNNSLSNNYETNSFNLYEKKGNQTFNNNNSRISSFVSKTFDNKKINPETTNNSINKINSKINQSKDNIKKTKDYWKFYKKKETNNKFIPNDRSHLSLDLYQSQFFPGPSDYSSDKSFDLINLQNKYRYKSLFKNESTHSLKSKKEQLPGPGSYIKFKSLNEKNDKHLSINLATKEKRFKNLFSSASLSPWYYSSSSNNDNTNENNKLQNNLGLLNKDLYDFRRYIIKEETDDKGKVKQYYVEDKSYIKKNAPLIKNNIITNKKMVKNKEKKKLNDYKMDKLLKKYIIVRNAEKEYEVPGPGQYNIYMGFDKISKDKAIEKLQSPHRQENLIPEEVLKNYSKNKNNESNFTFFYGGNNNNIKNKFWNNNSKSCENIFYGGENNKNSNGTLPFISKEKRIKFQDVILSKHTPGPCYYYNDDYY